MTTGTLKLSGAVTAAEAPVSAGLPIRLAATAIDVVVVETVTIVAALVAHLVLTVTRPSTLGTRQPIGMARAFLRLVGMTAGNILLVEAIVAFLHRDRRALHDLLADSIVMEAR